MYAIFETGGKQYKVVPGDVLKVEKLSDANDGKPYVFDHVLAISDDKKLLVGNPLLAGATVTATVLGNGRGEKVIIFKYKAKKDYRRKQGHRQPFTEIEIESAELSGKKVLEKAAPKKKAPAKKDVPADDVKKEPDDKDKSEVKEKPAAKPKAKAEPKKAPAVKKEADKEKKPAEKKAPVKKEAAKPEKDKAEAKPEANEKPKAKPAVSDKPKAEPKAKTTAKKEPAPKKAPVKKADAKPAADKPAAMTKPLIMEKLDALGVSYVKSAKKEDLLALLTEAEKKK